MFNIKPLRALKTPPESPIAIGVISETVDWQKLFEEYLKAGSESPMITVEVAVCVLPLVGSVHVAETT